MPHWFNTQLIEQTFAGLYIDLSHQKIIVHLYLPRKRPVLAVTSQAVLTHLAPPCSAPWRIVFFSHLLHRPGYPYMNEVRFCTFVAFFRYLVTSQGFISWAKTSIFVFFLHNCTIIVLINVLLDHLSLFFSSSSYPHRASVKFLKPFCTVSEVFFSVLVESS